MATTTEGNINIRGGDFLTFTKVYFTLKGTQLLLYHENTDKKPILTLNCTSASIKRLISTAVLAVPDPLLTFEIYSTEYYQIKCQSEDQFISLFNRLNTVMTPIGYFGNSVLFASEKSKWVVPLPLYRFIPYLEEKNFYVTNNLLDYLIPENEVLKFLNVLELGSDIDPSTIPLQLSFEIVRIYLDSLTDPIINVDYFSIKKSLQSDSQLNKVDAIKSIFDELDNNRKSVVYFVIRHMYNIFNNSQQNGVSAEEIAELFGKSLIYNNADFGYENVRNSFVRLVLEEFDYVSENVLEFGKTLGNPPNYPVGTGESKCHYLEDVELSVSKFVNKCDCGGMNEQIREENQSKKKGHYSQTVANKQSSVFKNGSQTGPKTPVRKVMTPDRFKRRSAIPQMIGELHQNKFTIGQCRKNASKSEQERSESGECTTRDLSPEYQEEKCEDLEKAKNPIATQFKVVVHSSRVSTFTPLSARTSSKLVISHEE